MIWLDITAMRLIFRHSYKDVALSPLDHSTECYNLGRIGREG